MPYALLYSYHEPQIPVQGGGSCAASTDSIMEPIVQDAATLGSINVLLWLLSLPLGKTWPVDFIWSLWPSVQGIVILTRAPEGVCSRQIVVCVLVAVWGYRLTHNFVSRGGIGHEDWRYADMRTAFGAHFWWISLFSVFLGQTVFLFAACLPLYGALANALPFPSGMDVAAVGFAVSAILLEAVADCQMDAHIAAKREKRSDAVVLSNGLWAWSRHPNYCGEILWWWSVWLFGASSSPTWPALAGPLAITFLFVAISVKLIEDRQLLNKGDAYREYQRAVPSPLLPIPPAVGRWFGRKLASGTAAPMS